MDFMFFKPASWRPIAIVLSILNIGGLVMALAAGEAMHSAGHVVAGLALAAWVRRLGERARESARESISGTEQQAQLESLESDMDQLRRELTETQERLDFAERRLAQKR